MPNTTPWEELRELAAMNKFKGHYKDNPRNMPEVQPEYTELAKRRQYEPDDRRVRATFDDSIAHFRPDHELEHSSEQVYGFLESLGAKMIPHGSQGTPDYTSVMNGQLARGEGELDHGHFFAHLVGNEQCLREWQKEMGADVIDDAVCLAGLLHSLYGTQGYQAAQFPLEKRAQIAQLIGERAERLVFWTCAMERPTWRNMVLANKGLQQGETPVGDFSGRRSALGQEMETGFSGEEHWKLSAQEFTVSSRDIVCARCFVSQQQPKRNRCGQDMCAVQLSHVLKQANNGSTMTPGDVRLFAPDQRTNRQPDQFVTGCNRRLWRSWRSISAAPHSPNTRRR